MKKLILALVAVSSFGLANAQKNSILVYGNAGIMTNKSDEGKGTESKSFNWNINPGVGYQFTNNLTVGVQGGIHSMFNENRFSPAKDVWNRNAMENREWSAGAFFRYTKNFGSIFAAFAQIDLSYLSGQDIYENETRNVDLLQNKIVETRTYGYDYYNGFAATVTPAFAVYVHKGLALNFSVGGLGYRTISYDVPKAPTSTNGVIDQSGFNLTFGKQFHFGISKNFACKSKRGSVKPGDELRPMKVEEDEE